MAQRRFHYDLAFEHYLRAKTIPYVAVDEARKAIHGPLTLKNFDFVVYGAASGNYLIDVKGRKHAGRSDRHLDNWVTQEDVADMLRWQELFGSGFTAAFVFLYWCQSQPPDALFQEIFTFQDRWYALLAVTVRDYQEHLKPRSPRWGTVYCPAESFAKMARPLMTFMA